MFFEDGSSLLRTLVVGVLAYAALVLMLRASGKRTLSKWNAFDFVVTIAIGSTLATALLSKQTTPAQGVVAFAVLVGLQYAITWLSVRSGLVRRGIKSEPRLLLHRGEVLHDALRTQGFARVEDVGAVVLETDGSSSVIGDLSDGPASALGDVRGYPPESSRGDSPRGPLLQGDEGRPLGLGNGVRYRFRGGNGT